MEKFHITITNNKTAETVVNIDTSAIIGAVDDGESTRVLCFTDCDGLSLAATCVGALEAVGEGQEGLPEGFLRWIRKHVKKLSNKLNKNPNKK
jgi:hypothetical protein